MHEVSIMRNLLAIALDEWARAGTDRIAVLRVTAGDLSGIVPEALRFAFDVLRSEHPATAGARLEIERVPASCRCRGCGMRFEPADVVFQCPGCEATDAEILRGRELELTRMEIN